MSVQSDLLRAVNSVAGLALGFRSVKKMDESSDRLGELKEALKLQTQNLEEAKERVSRLEKGEKLETDEKPKILVDGYGNPYKKITPQI